MILRPATPLTVILLAAFALLLLSVLTAPIIQGIPLAKVGDVAFGVFGSCNGGDCSGIEIGYDVGMLPSSCRPVLALVLYTVY